MEERGRGRFVLKRRRLLTALALAVLSARGALFAVDVSVFVSSFELEPGQSLVVEFSVPDADPDDVTLSDFPLPPSFAAATGRKELRYAGADAVTVISREWIPSESGSFAIGPFTLVVRGERVTVAPVKVTVTGRRTASLASLSWKDGASGDPAERAMTGSPLTICLVASFTGTAGNVSCPAPENAILEPVSFPVPSGTRLSATSGEPAVVAVWKWTPLETGWQDLPSATMRFVDENGTERILTSAPAGRTVARGDVPAATRRVPSSVARLFSGIAGDTGANDGGVANGGDVVADVGGDAGEQAVSKPADSGQSTVAETLARLRHAEHTSFFPAKARKERIALEDSLGLSPSLPVFPAAWKPVAVIGSVACFALGFLLRLGGRPSRKTGSFFRYATVLLFTASFALAIASITLYTRDRDASGVCRECELYHVPESGSSVIARLPEGFAARIGRRVGEWAYVSTSDGLAGWVQDDAIIEYTAGQ